MQCACVEVDRKKLNMNTHYFYVKKYLLYQILSTNVSYFAIFEDKWQFQAIQSNKAKCK